MPRFRFDFLSRLTESLNGWVMFGWVWLANLLAFAVMIAFRTVKTSGIAQTFEIEDVPLLQALDLQFGWLVFASAMSSAVLSGFLFASAHAANRRDQQMPALFLFRCLLMWGLGLFACRFVQPSAGLGVEIEPVGLLDWFTLLLACGNSWTLLTWITRLTDHPASLPAVAHSPESKAVRMSWIYLLGCGSVAVFAFLEHARFWDPAKNGGYDHRVYFLPGEVEQANQVFYSTSLLFASIAALAGCAAFLVLRWLSRKEIDSGEVYSPSEVRKHAVCLGLFWSAGLTIPWEIKILPEIIANDGWILPAISLGMTTAGLMPLLLTSGLLMRRDFLRSASYRADSSMPRRSEWAMWNFLLFPIYPLLRLVFPKKSPFAARAGVLMSLTAGMIASLMWVFQKIDDLFEFDDWRNMLRSGLFPFLQVLMSLLAAAWIYLCAQRFLIWISHKWRQRNSAEPPAIYSRWLGGILRIGVVSAAIGTLAIASWPFWGWQGIPENVFTRAIEFSNRHEFELRFLHWVFDADRDGYAAVLHGADPDDADPDLQAGGVSAPRVVRVPIDEYAIADQEKCQQFPNVAIFFLEGVTCRSISAYGKRNLPNGLLATPHMDAIARDGTLFTEARCYYPSTWDGWFAVNSGRILRIAEMHAGKSFGDRYSRYNNLYKILKLGGVTRWCHADTAPYFDLFVPNDLRNSEETAWKSGEDYNSSVSTEEEEQGVWRGDKRAKRITDFLDSIQPGERFFFCEHMSDTHFPWERTSKERALELGFPDGLEIYEADAVLPGGGTHDTYSRYLQTITRMDAQIGTIVDKMKQKNLYDDTLIIIVSDHGCQWFEHDHMYYVSHLYDQSLRIPLIIKTPGLPSGQVSHEPVMQIDIVPTLAELAGLRLTNPTEERPQESRSLMPLLNGDFDYDRELYRNRDILLCTHYDTLGVISNFQHKMIFDRPTGTFWIFDLENDPGETINLADSRPDLKQDLLKRLRDLTERHASFVGEIAAADQKPTGGTASSQERLAEIHGD